MNRILTVTLTLIAVSATSLAQTTYTFQPSSGVWDTPGNWDPTGKPVAGDKAIIPSGRTCRIENEDAAVKLLAVDGTLRISGYSLTLGDPADNTTLELGGRIEFKKPSTEVPELLIYNEITTTGPGTIDAQVDPADTDEGIIGDADSPADSRLVIGSQTFVEGSITFLVSVTNDGHMIVDDDADTMVLGGSESPPTNEFEGSGGSLSVSGNGTIRINAMDLDGTGTWTVTGSDNSLLWLTDKFAIPNPGSFNTDIEVKRGTLDIDAELPDARQLDLWHDHADGDDQGRQRQGGGVQRRLGAGAAWRRMHGSDAGRECALGAGLRSCGCAPPTPDWRRGFGCRTRRRMHGSDAGRECALGVGLRSRGCAPATPDWRRGFGWPARGRMHGSDAGRECALGVGLRSRGCAPATPDWRRGFGWPARGRMHGSDAGRECALGVGLRSCGCAPPTPDWRRGFGCRTRRRMHGSDAGRECALGVGLRSCGCAPPTPDWRRGFGWRTRGRGFGWPAGVGSAGARGGRQVQ
ncbi:MAG: hypothetical protein CHACPFDD_03975 [Phycisphaerae bacterium]|nr:hypothetical protein [Phycisphaerae bacterium]